MLELVTLAAHRKIEDMPAALADRSSEEVAAWLDGLPWVSHFYKEATVAALSHLPEARIDSPALLRLLQRSKLECIFYDKAVDELTGVASYIDLPAARKAASNAAMLYARDAPDSELPAPHDLSPTKSLEEAVQTFFFEQHAVGMYAEGEALSREQAAAALKSASPHMYRLLLSCLGVRSAADITPDVFKRLLSGAPEAVENNAAVAVAPVAPVAAAPVQAVAEAAPGVPAVVVAADVYVEPAAAAAGAAAAGGGGGGGDPAAAAALPLQQRVGNALMPDAAAANVAAGGAEDEKQARRAAFRSVLSKEESDKLAAQAAREPVDYTQASIEAALAEPLELLLETGCGRSYRLHFQELYAVLEALLPGMQLKANMAGRILKKRWALSINHNDPYRYNVRWKGFAPPPLRLGHRASDRSGACCRRCRRSRLRD